MLYLNLDIVRMATTELLIHLGEEIVVEEISYILLHYCDYSVY